MAAQYSNKQFFRKTPSQYLARYYETNQIQLAVDFNEFKETTVEPIQEASNASADS